MAGACSRLLDGSIAAFAVWTVYCHVLVSAGADFDLFTKMSWIPLFMSVMLIRYQPQLRSVQLAAGTTAVERSSVTHLPRAIWLAGATVIVASYALGASYLAFWLATVAFLAALMRFGAPPAAAPERASMQLPVRWSNVIVVLLILATVVITLVSHRPDIDDAFYLNLAVSALDHPDLPPYQFDGMHGEAGLPLLADFYRIVSYELLVAVVASLTTLPPAAVYYLAAPAIMALLVIVAYWLALRELGGTSAIIGLAVTWIVLIAWGDTHRAYGNFAFVRLFQGKSALISFCIPALVYYAVRFSRQRDATSWVGLALTQIAAIGFSSSALVVAPVASALVLLGGWRPNRDDTKVLFLGLMASVYVIGTAMVVSHGMENPSSVMAGTGQLLTTEQGLKEVLGTDGRALLALFALLTVPILASTPARHRLLSGILLATAVLVLNPFTADLVGRVASNMSWRIHWSVPFPLWIGLAGAGIAVNLAAFRSWRWGVAGCALWTVLFVALPGSWTMTTENRTRLDVPGYKVTSDYEVAEAVVAATPPDGSVLAPWNVTAWIPTHTGHPSVAAVRPHYLSVIASAHGTQEARARRAMVSFVSGGEVTKQPSTAIIDTIVSRNFTTIVLPIDLLHKQQITQRLLAIGYVPSISGNYEIWSR